MSSSPEETSTPKSSSAGSPPVGEQIRLFTASHRNEILFNPFERRYEAYAVDISGQLVMIGDCAPPSVLTPRSFIDDPVVSMWIGEIWRGLVEKTYRPLVIEANPLNRPN